MKLWMNKRILLIITIMIITATLFTSFLVANFNIYNSICTDTSGECTFPGQLTHQDTLALHKVGLSQLQYSLLRLFDNFLQTSGYLIVAFILLWKIPRNKISSISALILISLGLSYSSDNLQLLMPNFSLVFSILGFLSSMYIIFFYIYPDGKLQPKITIYLSLLWVLISLGRNFFQGSVLDPFTWPAPFEVIGWIGFHLSALIIQLIKYRTSEHKQQKQQMKWLMYGLLVTVLAITVISILEHTGTKEIPVIISDLLIDFLLSLAALFLPISILIAILFYRLWDIDFVIKKTFVYSTLIVISTSIYIIVVGTLNALLQTQGNYFISLIAAGILAVTFQPLYKQMEHSIQKVIYGDLKTPHQIFTKIGKRYDTADDKMNVIFSILETILDSLKFPYAGVRFKNGYGYETQEELGTKPAIIEEIDLMYRKQKVGILQIGSFEPFTKKEKKLIGDIAHHVSIAVHAHILSEKNAKSKREIILAREEERKKLRHELHDGVGPSIATIKLLAEAAQDSKRAPEILNQIQTQSQYLLKTLREIVESLRPNDINQFGLRQTLENYLHHLELAGIKAQFIAPESFPYIDDITVIAIYRITQEAIHNVIKHSQASFCQVILMVGDQITLKIEDNGIGFKVPRTNGIGLESMRERAVQRGGSLEVHSNPGTGTTIIAKFPNPALEG